MSLSLRHILEIFSLTTDGLKQQSLSGEFETFEVSYPRDPIYVARGIEAVFGFRIKFVVVDFYLGLNIPEDRRDFYSFYEYGPGEEVTVYLNSNKLGSGANLLNEPSQRFVILKEIFTASIRSAITKGLVATEVEYPDTVEFPEFISAHLDWISEKFSVYAFDDGEDFAATVSVENAAELLAILFLVNVPELYQARVDLNVKPKPLWKVDGEGVDHDSDEADGKFSLFDYEKYARSYGVKDRLIVVLVRTDFIIKIVEELKGIVGDIRDVFSLFSG